MNEQSQIEFEKRQFQRIAIDLQGDLLVAGQLVKVKVLDISLRGVRIQVPAYINHNNEDVTLYFRANSDSPEIAIVGKFTHHCYTKSVTPCQEAGVQISHISVDDISLLRRMLLLNSDNEHLDISELNALLNQLNLAAQQQQQ